MVIRAHGEVHNEVICPDSLSSKDTYLTPDNKDAAAEAVVVHRKDRLMNLNRKPTLSDKFTPEGEPTVLGVPYGKSQVKVQCPYCGKTHLHGRLDGSRGSHCEDRSIAGGYYIVFEEPCSGDQNE